MRFVFLVLILLISGLSIQGCATARPGGGGGYNNDYGGD